MLVVDARRSPALARLIPVRGSLLLAGLLLACAGSEPTAPKPSLGNGPNGKNAPVQIAPESGTLDALNATLQLSANTDVTWSSLTPAVATVDAVGRVSSVGNGLALIQALSIGGKKADTAEILVRQTATSVVISPDTLNVVVGDTGTLSAAAADANGYSIVDAVVSWVSDLLSVATVSDGLVTGVDSGTTTIRATVDGVSDTAQVIVDLPANPYP